VRPLVSKFVIGVDAILNADGSRIPVEGKVLLNDNGGWPEHFYGDEVRISGKLRKPEWIDDFDYPHYLELQGIRAVITRGTIQTEKPADLSLIGVLTHWRTKVENQVGMILPEPHASLLARLLTGSRRGLPDDVSDQFRTSGITHIVAISGYNITMILALLSSLLFWLPLKWRFWPLATGVILFTLFVGASPPVVRAAIMGILGLLALQANRLSVPRLTALWAAFAMLLWNPMMIWYDASFQLSFMALVGIMELTPLLKKLFDRVPNTLAIRDSLITTVAAQIGTLPISMIIFQQLSLVSPFTNLLVAPLVPIAMLLGFIAMCVSTLWLPLGLTVSYLAWAVLQCILWIGEFGSIVPLAAIRW
jgi:competence protein ComEC